MIAGYHHSCPTTCSGTDWYKPSEFPVVTTHQGFSEWIADELAKEFQRVTRLLARMFRKRRPQNKSTVPTALLTPQYTHGKSGRVSRPNQKASTYG